MGGPIHWSRHFRGPRPGVARQPRPGLVPGSLLRLAGDPLHVRIQTGTEVQIGRCNPEGHQEVPRRRRRKEGQWINERSCQVKYNALEADDEQLPRKGKSRR